MNIDATAGSKYQNTMTVRPYDFGTDAIERQRVSLGQSLIDADFEYGLQATKWQSYSEIRKIPTFYDIPGSDMNPITSVTSDGSNPSTITVNTTTSIMPSPGYPVSVTGLENATRNADRAEGFFLVTSNTASSFTYTAKGLVTAGTISTSYTVAKRGGFYNANSATSGNACVYYTSVTGNGTYANVNTPTVHGLIPGMPIVCTGFSGGTGTVNGNFFVENVANATTFSFASSLNGTATGGRIYPLTYSFQVHRPFDGGVSISPNQICFGALAARQSKKVFRYQSGKGLLWSSGTLFCPNNDLSNIYASSNTVGSNITVQTSISHNAQVGCSMQIRGVNTSGYNGTYIVNGVVNNKTLNVSALTTLGNTVGSLGDRARFIIPNWHGSSVRAGIFDDQNGLFWEYDGQTLWVVKRSSTFQISGTVTCAANGTVLTGTNTRFTTQLKVNDKFTIRGMTYCVTSILSDTSLTFLPPYRGTSDITVGITACKIREQRTPQSQFNRDKVNGTGPSGFLLDVTKMQMLGIQYTWYGAGFIDFMVRGADGNWVYAHRYTQNNVNDEAYMRTGNMPVRYEIVNETSHAVTQLLTAMGPSDTTIYTTDDLTYWPSSGSVYIDSEIISYSSKTSNTFIVNSRPAPLSYNMNDTQRTFTGGPSSAHLAGNTVMLVSTTCCPTLTHWGSAFLIDGLFDNDRGYLFNYQQSSFTASLAAGSTTNIFMIRLAPSVSNGVIGDIGTRDLLNRAQLLLQRLDVWAQASNVSVGSIVVSGVLNPSFSTTNITVPSSWVAINSAANGSQPSFAQVYSGTPLQNLGTYISGTGERVFSTICNAGSQYSIDLTGLKEICNGLIGGKNMFPDGPDTLLIQITVPANSVTVTNYSLNLFWSEAQA